LRRYIPEGLSSILEQKYLDGIILPMWSREMIQMQFSMVQVVGLWRALAYISSPGLRAFNLDERRFQYYCSCQQKNHKGKCGAQLILLAMQDSGSSEVTTSVNPPIADQFLPLFCL
jgi:hypothetical protein